MRLPAAKHLINYSVEYFFSFAPQPSARHVGFSGGVTVVDLRMVGFSWAEELCFADTVPAAVGESGEASTLIGSEASQPTMGFSTVNCFMPRVPQTFFPLQNHAKLGGLYGHTRLNFE